MQYVRMGELIFSYSVGNRHFSIAELQLNEKYKYECVQDFRQRSIYTQGKKDFVRRYCAMCQDFAVSYKK